MGDNSFVGCNKSRFTVIIFIKVDAQVKYCILIYQMPQLLFIICSAYNGFFVYDYKAIVYDTISRKRTI